MIYSPSSNGYNNIVATLASVGADVMSAEAEQAFRAWYASARASSGHTNGRLVLLQPNTTTTIRLVISGKAGATIGIWWGDGASATVVSANNYEATHTYASAGKYGVVIVGDLTVVSSDSGDGSTEFYGDISYCRDLAFVLFWGNNRMSGDISMLAKAGYISFSGNAAFHGNLAGCASVTYFVAFGANVVTYNTSPGLHTFHENMDMVEIFGNYSGVFTSAMVDSLLIDLANVSSWVGGKSISLTGGCGAPTAAADDAIDSLITQGVAVNTN